MRKFLAAAASAFLFGVGSPIAVHATPPSPANCDNQWHNSSTSAAGIEWYDSINRHFHTDTFTAYYGQPDGAGNCYITYAWSENAYQIVNGQYVTPPQFVKHHLRFRVWTCGTLVKDDAADYTSPNSGWIISQTYFYGYGCTPQSDNYGYTGTTAGSFVGEAGIGITPVAYVYFNNW